MFEIFFDKKSGTWQSLLSLGIFGNLFYRNVYLVVLYVSCEFCLDRRISLVARAT